MQQIAVKIAPTSHLLPAIEVLEMRAQIRAFLWWNWMMEMDEAVDELQAYAETSDLVQEIGQDAVQEIIAAPFARLRSLAGAEDVAFAAWLENEEQDDLSDFDRKYIARCIGRWEAEDAKPGKAAATHQVRSNPPASSTVAAFKYVVGLGDRDRLASWLRDHTADATALLALLEKAE